jgi:hypothetical protein
MAKVKKAKVADLIQDDQNANQGTEIGRRLIESSIETLGLGRSVLVDKDNRLIAGNKTQEGTLKNGIENAIIVETDGTELIVVKRTDLSLDDDKGRALALADNRASELNLNWNPERLEMHVDAAINLGLTELKFDTDVTIGEGGGAGGNAAPKDLSDSLDSVFKIELEFQDEGELQTAFENLTEQGYKCKILTL